MSRDLRTNLALLPTNAEDNTAEESNLKSTDEPLVSTQTIRQRLQEQLTKQMRERESAIIQAPTSTGKTYLASTTPWRDYANITGDAPVIVLSQSTQARDSAYRESQESSATPRRLKGRQDTCPIIQGEYDKENTGGNDTIAAPDDSDPSDWFSRMCDDLGLPVSYVHNRFQRHHDGCIPCSDEAAQCEVETQWDGLLLDDDESYSFDVLHATHSFAYVPSLIEGANVVIDEYPDFTAENPQGLVSNSVRSYLKHVGADIQSWPRFIIRAKDGELPDGFLRSLDRPSRDWFRNNPDAHGLIPGVTQAIAQAERRSNGRWVGETSYTFPDLLPNSSASEQGMRIKVIINQDDEIEEVYRVPDFSEARCVIGLDAFPTMPLWRIQTLESIKGERIVSPEEFHSWRRNERNLKIIQVGDNKNSWTTRNSENKKVRALIQELRWEFGNEFGTAITSKSFERELQKAMSSAGIESASTLHYGGLRSLNEFGSEKVGLLAGCISPGHEVVKNWLALLDKDVNPRCDVDEEHHGGEEWVGPDVDVAEELRAHVREKEMKQACGRYARSPDDPDDGATVYVLSSVLPENWVDEVKNDVQVFGDGQREILEHVRENGPVKPSTVTQGVESGYRHTVDTLGKVVSRSWIQSEKAETQGKLYSVDYCPDGMVDL